MTSGEKVGNAALGIVAFQPKLKPCPFCGSPALLKLDNRAGCSAWVEKCPVFTEADSGQELTVEEWNTRAAPDREEASRTEIIEECIKRLRHLPAAVGSLRKMLKEEV